MCSGSVSRESLGQRDLQLLNNISGSHKLLHAAPAELLNIFPPPEALLNIPYGKMAVI